MNKFIKNVSFAFIIAFAVLFAFVKLTNGELILQELIWKSGVTAIVVSSLNLLYAKNFGKES